MDKKIPQENIVNNNIDINYIDEPLVEIKNSEKIIVDMQYYKLNYKYAINKAYLRKTVYDKLIEASETLPEEYKFIILDAWRPFELQKELFENNSKRIIDRFNLNELTEVEQNNFISKYVAYPDMNSKNVPAHTTGGAVDLMLIYNDGRNVDLGIKFDEFTNKACSAYYEKDGENIEIRTNRRIIYNAMINAGFSNLPSEIWHYDFGDLNWARYTNNTCIYNAISAI